MTAIARPDSEAAWVHWLTSHGFPQARTTVPDVHVDGMLRVSRVGGDRTSLISETASMLFEVWSATHASAADLAHQINAVVESVPDGGHLDPDTRVYHVQATGPVEFPDQGSALVRFQFTASCMTRRVAA